MKRRLFDQRVNVEENARGVTIEARADTSRWLTALFFLTILAAISAPVFYGFSRTTIDPGNRIFFVAGAAAGGFALILGVAACFFAFHLRRVRVEVDSAAGVCRITRFRSVSIPLGEISAVELKTGGDGDAGAACFSLRRLDSRSLPLFHCSFVESDGSLPGMEGCRDFGQSLAERLRTRLIEADARPRRATRRVEPED